MNAMRLAAKRIHEAFAETTNWQKPFRIYHYTVPQGLRGILKEGVMWATHLNYMNDPLEIRYGHDLCKNVLLEAESTSSGKAQDLAQFGLEAFEEFSDPSRAYTMAYCVSFTESRDKLAQWRAYANSGRGIAIGFDFAGLGDVLQSADDVNEPGFRLVKMTYRREEQGEIIKKFWYAVKDSYLLVLEKGETGNYKDPKEQLGRYGVNQMLMLASSFKQPGFIEEAEWRAIPVFMGLNYAANIRFRVRNGYLIPYIEMRVRKRNKGSLIPVSEIIIGPSLNDPAINETVSLLLCASGYDKHRGNFPKIFSSDIQLRAF